MTFLFLQVSIEIMEGGSTVQMPWQEYLQQYVDERQHEIIRTNVLLATRNFQHRVNTFKKEVIFGSNQPMKIMHFPRLPLGLKNLNGRGSLGSGGSL